MQFLGLDVGTQGTKALVIDTDRHEVVARASAGYGTIPGLPAGASEQDPLTWIVAVADVVAQLYGNAGVDRSQLNGVGVSGQQHGLVVLDEQDQVVRPAKLWNDTTSAPEAAEIATRWGIGCPASYTASKILWLKRHEPDRWGRIRSVLLPHDYVNFILTGRMTMEPGDASGTGFFDPISRSFDHRILDWLDPSLAAMLPPLIADGQSAGQITSAAAARLGLPEGVIVAAGAGDNMASAIGSGATEPGPVIASIGTSGTAFAYADHPVVDPDGLIAAFCDSTGGWLPLLAVMNMTEVTTKVLNLFPDLDYGSATDLAREVPAGSEGLLMLPYLRGERVPNLPDASGSLLGLRLGNLSPGHLFRAAIEGTSLSLAIGIDRMEELGLQVDALRVVGGGSRNPLWRQILADATGVPVASLAEAESGALGAAIQALWTYEGGASSTITELASPYIGISNEVVNPSSANEARYVEMKEQMKLATSRLHG